jgi:hypothetical protein
MATTDSELITEVRALTDYPQEVISDSEMQELVDIGKQELQARFNQPGYAFYTGDHSADRALFWFTCIAAKVKAGEIAGVNLEVGDIAAQSPAATHYDYWFEAFQERLNEAINEVSGYAGPAHKLIERDDRNYE